MNSIKFYKLVLFLVVILATIFYFTFSFFNLSSFISHADAINIAILTPTTHLALEEIEQGFKETMRKGNLNYSFTTFNANGNKTLLRAQAEEIIQRKFDLIFTIGAGTTQIIAELLSKKNITIPHVFGGVDGPEFAQSMSVINPNSTGVYVKIDYGKQMDIVCNIKPDMKNILLVYDPSHGTGLEKDKLEVEKHLKKYQIKLKSVEVYQTNEIQQKVLGLISSVDAVLVLTDNTVVAGLDALIKLCNRYKVPLIASDLSSGKKGALIAYGITEYDSGSGAALKALEIIENNKKPNQLIVTPIDNFRLEINKSSMNLQGLNFDDTALKQLKVQNV